MNVLNVFTGVSVDNIDTAKDFYQNTLGLDLASEVMGLHFRLPYGGMLFIYPKPDHRPASYTYLNFVVPNIDQAVDELVEKGITFERYNNTFPGAPGQDEKGIQRTSDPETQGPSIAWFKDPAGNIIALIEDAQKQ